MNAADTNVWLYAVDHREPIKRQRAYDLQEELARAGETVSPWQVASEFVNGLRRWESKQVLTPEKVNDFVGWMIAILLRGEFALNGFRNRDLRDLLFPTLPATASNSTASNSTASNSTATPNADEAALPQRRRQAGQVTRLLRLFRAHRLIQKIPRTHRYQLTANGRRILPTFSAARAASTQALRGCAFFTSESCWE